MGKLLTVLCLSIFQITFALHQAYADQPRLEALLKRTHQTKGAFSPAGCFYNCPPQSCVANGHCIPQVWDGCSGCDGYSGTPSVCCYEHNFCTNGGTTRDCGPYCYNLTPCPIDPGGDIKKKRSSLE